MKRFAILPVLFLVGACGVDGEPIPPGEEEDEVVSQEAAEPIRPKINGSISVGSSGTHVGLGTTLTRGNVTIGVGTSF